MLRSMTGFARVRHQWGDATAILSLKSVNHRGLDLHFQSGPELDAVEGEMRSRLKKAIGRGHIDVRVQIQREGNGSSSLFNQRKLGAYVAALREIGATLDVNFQPDLNQLMRLPGVLGDESEAGVPGELGKAVLVMLDEAVEELNRFRAKEGAEIAEYLLARNQELRSTAEELSRIRGGVQEALARRLRERLKDLLAGGSLDPQRVAGEAALLAERGDIGEEIERLLIHTRQLETSVREEADAGKKLDFLLQEMNRETNTILSKTSGAGEGGLRITELGIAAKSEIEKMREQVLNLE